MAAYGVVHDENGPVAVIKDGVIYRDGEGGEVIGYEENGQVLGLNRQYVGELHPLGAVPSASVIRQLIKPER